MRIPNPGYCGKFIVEMLNTGIGFSQLRYVKQRQNRAGKNLNNEEQQGCPTKKMVPMRLFNFHG